MRLFLTLVTAVLTVSSAALGSPLPAIPDDPHFFHITTEDGLPDNSVWALHQDRSGFLWIGTENGLVRYDGYEMVVYRPPVDGSGAVVGHHVTVLHEDREGVLWIGTREGGLSSLDLSTNDHWNHVPFPGRPSTASAGPITGISSDREGGLWVCSRGDGLARLDPGGVAFEQVVADAAPAPGVELAAVSVAEDGRVWVADHSAGIWIREPDGGDWRLLGGAVEREGEPVAIRVNQIFQSRSGEVWITGRGGLGRWSAEGTRLASYFPGDGNGWANWMMRLSEDSRGRLWIGSPGGLQMFDPDEETSRFFVHQPGLRHSLAEGPVMVVLCDDSGAVWTGAWQAGLSVLDPWRGQFELITHDPDDTSTLDQDHVGALLLDRRGNLWVGTGGLSSVAGPGGLNRRAPGQTGFDRIEFPAEIAPSNVIALAETADGTVWVLASPRLLMVPPGEKRARLPELGPSAAELIGEALLVSAAADDAGALWLGGYIAGVTRFDPATGEAEEYRHDPTDPSSLSHDDVVEIFFDSSGQLWVGTSTGGLNLYLPDQSAFRRIPGPSTIVDIEDAGEGRVYVASSDALFLVGPDGSCEPLIEAERHLGDATIASIVRDQTGDLWIHTVRDLLRMDLDSGRVAVFGSAEGVPGGEVHYPGIRIGDQVLFATKRGVLTFRPDEILDRPARAPVVITQVRVNGVPWEGDEDDEARAFPYVDQIDLVHDQNDLQFSFAALSLIRADRNQYRYRLGDDDVDWRYAGPRNEATYAKLPSGSYTFQVQARHAGGDWILPGTSLQLTIRPPWWRTTVAYASYLVLLMAIVATIYRQIIQRERVRTALEVQRAEARHLHELDELKSKFFANISHEFRTPLSLIAGSIQVLDKHASESSRSTLDMMRRNAVRLRELIDQLLDISRLESGRLPIHWECREVQGFVRALSSSFETLAMDRRIELVVVDDGREEEGWFARDLVEKIVVNLLSNAFKFTPNGGRVSVNLRLTESAAPREVPTGTRREPHSAMARMIVLRVLNTGSFIEPEQRPDVFDRFHQLAEGSGGSGIGLALVKEIVETLGGSISLASDRTAGTEFTVRLPVYLEPPVPGLDAAAAEDPASVTTALGGVDDRAEPAADTPERGGPEEPEAEPASAHLLIVEDNADMRLFLESELCDEYRVSLARDGEEGLSRAFEEIPELVLSDVMMPGMGGVELARRLKQDERTSHVPVILLTARSETGDRVEGLEAGADDYLAKPFELLELRARIRNLVEQRRLMRERFARQLSQLEPAAVPVVSADDRFLRRAREVLEANLDNADFAVETFCIEVGMSRAQMLRKMKAVAGLTPSEFIRLHRLQRAGQLLRGGYGNVTEVAYAVGFRSLSTFAKRFRERFGVPPSEYGASESVPDPTPDES